MGFDLARRQLIQFLLKADGAAEFSLTIGGASGLKLQHAVQITA